MIRLLRSLRARLAAEDANATIEFVFLFPLFIGIFSSSFEAAMLTSRQVLLERATDMVVRELRLGIGETPTHDELKTRICEYAGVIPDCDQSLNIELEIVSTETFAIRTGAVQCVDREQDITPALSFTPGLKNELMLVTVCAVFQTMNPVSGLGLRLPKLGGNGYYGIVATSAFVNEPS